MKFRYLFAFYLPLIFPPLFGESESFDSSIQVNVVSNAKTLTLPTKKSITFNTPILLLSNRETPSTLFFELPLITKEEGEISKEWIQFTEKNDPDKIVLFNASLECLKSKNISPFQEIALKENAPCDMVLKLREETPLSLSTNHPFDFQPGQEFYAEGFLVLKDLYHQEIKREKMAWKVTVEHHLEKS